MALFQNIDNFVKSTQVIQEAKSAFSGAVDAPTKLNIISGAETLVNELLAGEPFLVEVSTIIFNKWKASVVVPA